MMVKTLDIILLTAAATALGMLLSVWLYLDLEQFGLSHALLKIAFAFLAGIFCVSLVMLFSLAACGRDGAE